MIETTSPGGLMQEQICNVTELENDLSESLLEAIVESQRIPAVTAAIQLILTKEEAEFEPTWTSSDGTNLSDLDYLCLPPWERIGCTRTREECNNEEEE